MSELATLSGKYMAYPEYFDYGIKWLPMLPRHWKVERVKRMLRLKRSLVGTSSADYQLLSLTLRGIITRDISKGEGKIPESFDTYQKVEESDLVFCLFDMDETPCTVGLSNLNGMITGAYNVYGCLSNCFPAYASYYFLHIDKRKGLRPFYTGLRKVVRSETFDNIEIPCPPIEEQRTIAAFLDYETARIDQLIAKQQRLIELLKEKHQAVISHAVTKGLNPNAPMKDSGVEWLGQVPKHWDVLQVRHLIRYMEQGKSPECEARNIDDCEWGVLKTGCVNGGIYNQNEHKALPSHITPHTAYEVRAGDLLMSRASGSRHLIGAVAYVDETQPRLLLSDKIFRLILESRVNARYFAFLMGSRSVRTQIELAINGAEGLANNITKESIKGFVIPMPDANEQIAILDYLKAKTEKYKLLEDELNKGLGLLQERRTALISAAVTGKIDVRGWNASNERNSV